MLCLSFRIVSAKAVILHPFSLLSPKGMENRLSFSSRRRDALSFIMGYLEVWRYRSCDNSTKNSINTREQWKTIQKPLLPYIAENWKYFDAFESSLQIINMS